MLSVFSRTKVQRVACFCFGQVSELARHNQDIRSTRRMNWVERLDQLSSSIALVQKHELSCAQATTAAVIRNFLQLEWPPRCIRGQLITSRDLFSVVSEKPVDVVRPAHTTFHNISQHLTTSHNISQANSTEATEADSTIHREKVMLKCFEAGRGLDSSQATQSLTHNSVQLSL